MTVWLILSGIIAPALFWIVYLYYKDRYKPEPLLHIGFSYLLGFMAAYLGFQAYGFLPLIGIPSDPSALMVHNSGLFLLYCIFVVGLIEELLKYLPFVLVVMRFKCFDENIDGIIYAAVISLGFASFENLNYLLYLQGFELFGRAIATPLTHTMFASVWGYLVGLAFLSGKSLWRASLLGLGISALLHGLFDFFTLSSNIRILAALLILGIWILRIYVIEKLQKSERNKKGWSGKNRILG